MRLVGMLSGVVRMSKVTKVVAQEVGWSHRAETICQDTRTLIPRSDSHNSGRDWRPTQVRTQSRRLSLQLRVLRLGLLQDGDVGIGVFPHREKIVIGSARPGGVSFQHVGTCKAKTGE
jgi:hypothetical protein